MNVKKAALVAGLAAIAVVAWVVLRGGSETTSGSALRQAQEGGGTDERVQRVKPPIRMSGGVEPELEGVPAQLPTPAPVIIDAAEHASLAEDFEAERRDPAWATAHEREIDRRLAALPADGIALERSECRAHECRITLTAVDDAALGRYIGHLESDADGLYGYAQLIVLEAVTSTPDGRRRERVYARFE